MPPSGQQSSQQGGDNSLAPFWILVGTFAVGWLVWHFAHEQIAMSVMYVRLWEARFISLFVESASSLVKTIEGTSPATMSFTDLANISTRVGDYLRYPIALLLGILTVIIYFSSATLRYKKVYSMRSLRTAEKENWPQITPVVNLDLVKEDINEGPWAMAASPMQFAKKHRLLQEERVVSETDLLATEQVIATLRREEAYQVFALQIGRYWTSPEDLNIHTKALFAVFAARANRDRDGANKLLREIAASTETGKLDFSGVKSLFEKHKQNKMVIKVCSKHAFILTVMASMLLLAREDGVLATADFLWLKPVDRSLWFMLNSVGRQTPFTEVSGPFAHWLAERKIGRKLNVPMIEEAVNALESALKEIIYVPDEEKI
jgi:intracellular multiplication protein IcmP